MKHANTAVLLGFSAHLQNLDPIPIRVFDEAQPRASLAHRVGGLLGPYPLLGQAGKGAIEVLGGYCDVPVPGTERKAGGAAGCPPRRPEGRPVWREAERG
jgi:hypothetical protein